MSVPSGVSLAAARAAAPTNQLAMESVALAALAAPYPVDATMSAWVQTKFLGAEAVCVPIGVILFWLYAPGLSEANRLSRMLVLLPVLVIYYKDEFDTRYAGGGGAGEVYHDFPHTPPDGMGWWRNPPMRAHRYRNIFVLLGNALALATTGLMTVGLGYPTIMAKACFGHGKMVGWIYEGLGSLILGAGRMTGVFCQRGLQSSGERLVCRQFGETYSNPLYPLQQPVPIDSISLHDLQLGLPPNYGVFVMLNSDKTYVGPLKLMPRVFGSHVSSDGSLFRSEIDMVPRTVDTIMFVKLPACTNVIHILP
jgi:hypothetical protein